MAARTDPSRRLGVSPAPPRRRPGFLYAATVGGIVYSFDGATWTDLGLTPNPGEIDSLAFKSSNAGITNSDVRGVTFDGTTATTVFAWTNGDGFLKTLTGGQ